MLNRIHCVIAALFASVAVAGTALADRPTDAVKSSTDKVLAILNHSGAAKSEQSQLIRTELDKRFDWPVSARGCLGHYWSARTPAEQKEFIGLFSEFLEETYVDKLETYYKDLNTIDYKAEKIVDDYASVKVVLKTKDGIEHPVEYRMQNSSNGWRVYDVIVEGISLVKNYRDQFDAIITKSSYEGLLKDIKSKLQAHQS